MIEQQTVGYLTLKADVDKIQKLLTQQFKALCLSQCPIVEEIIDTQMFGFSKEVDFAKRVQLITADEGNDLVSNLEEQVNQIYNQIYQAQTLN